MSDEWYVKWENDNVVIYTVPDNGMMNVVVTPGWDPFRQRALAEIIAGFLNKTQRNV
jgi:hypothetical protein